MSNHPINNPFPGVPLGTGMDQLDPRNTEFVSPRSVYPPFAKLEADMEAWSDDVPPLVGFVFPDLSPIPDLAEVERDLVDIRQDLHQPFFLDQHLVQDPWREVQPVRFLDLSDDTILPWVQADADDSCFTSGAFSTVSRVCVHPSHLSWSSSSFSESKSRDPTYIAVKQLRSSDAHAFEKEVRALHLLNRKPHRHIISFLGSYRLHNKYHLMFEWADSDLAMYWRLNSNPEPDYVTASWVAKQMKGLADALSYIHGYGCKDDDHDSWVHKPWLGRHGDIKPSNILLCGQGKTSIFKIADFGLSTFRTCETVAGEQLEEEPTQYTPAYRAPECALPTQEIGQRTDIFSLGCVFLETISWYLSGLVGLEQLAACRMDDTELGISTGDAFFQFIPETSGKSARLKPEIEDWIIRLQNHRHSSRFTDDVLRFIRGGMLAIESQLRSSALDVLQALRRICHELDNDTSYAASRESRGLTFDDEGHWEASGHLSPSGKEDAMAAPHLNVPLPHCKNDALTIPVSQVHSSTQSGHRNKRKWMGNGDTTGSDKKRTTQRKLACPYLKAGYAQSELSRACIGPGWDCIRRVKEHILRCHTPTDFKNPLVCGRCLEGFKSQELLVQHSREEPQCLIKSPEIINGKVSLEQAINLRSMKRKPSDMRDEDMWLEIYQVLFPSKELCASPYHEDLTLSSLNTLSTQSSTGISEYKDHLRRPMSENEQRALGEELGSALGISNPNLCKILAAKFREHQLKDIQQFDRQKLEPVYSIPVLNDDTLKAETVVCESQVGDVGPEDVENYQEFERWMKEFDTGDSEFDA